MTKRPHPAVIRLADALIEGESIDWACEATSDPELRDTFEGLRTIAAILSVHRGLEAGRSGSSSDDPTTLAGAAMASDSSAEAGAEPSRPLFHWGPLRVLEKIGAGSFGEVYRAYDATLEREVALKLWQTGASDAPVEKLLVEARLLARTRHPNVLVVYGADQHDGRPGMWTDLIRGQTLEELLVQQGPWGAREAALIGMELCRALAALHALGFVHRDVKTMNVMRELGGRIVLMDFGAVGARTTRGARDRNAPFAGTPLVLAPEQLNGEPATIASDVYSLGVLLYRLVSARYPIEADSIDALCDRHDRGESVPLRDRRPDLPARFVQVVERALAHRAADRFASAGAMERALASSIGITAFRQTSGAEAPRRAVDARVSGPETARGPKPTPHNLPDALTTFVGRERELETLKGLIRQRRWLTLNGIGGCGKTRLAVRLAESMLEEFSGGVWFVELGSVTDDSHVPHAAAMALGVRERARGSLVQAIADRLRGDPTLLVLDNCEHLISGAAELGETLLRSCPNLKIVATSREVTSVPGEQTFAVPALPFPTLDQSRANGFLSYPSIQLFVERAGLIVPGFALDHDRAAAVAEICRSLDGIPLAIELAAAQSNVLAVDEIRARLDQRFETFRTRNPRAPSRHRTLEAAMQGSYDLLAPEEQRLLRTLSVFAGGWELAAANVVFGSGDESRALELLSNLVDKSLVIVERLDDEGSRYRLLETVRQYARERLIQESEEPDARSRHLDYYLGLAEDARTRLAGADQARLLRRLETENENLLGALAWAGRDESQDAEKGLLLARALQNFWMVRGHLALGRRALENAIARAGGAAPARLRGRALCGVGIMAIWQGDLDSARRAFEEALSVLRESGDVMGVAQSLLGLGHAARAVGDLDLAWERYSESLGTYRELDHPGGMALALNNLGAVSMLRGAHAAALNENEQALAIARRDGNASTIVLVLCDLGLLSNLIDDRETARGRLRECLRLVRETEGRNIAPYALESTAALAAAEGDVDRAARLYAAADALRDQVGSTMLGDERRVHAPFIARIERELPRDRAAATRFAGHDLSFENAVDEAIAWLGPAPSR
jgi:non-specific serine/threonine protein kinase